jgi:DNA-binding CsgD family transcriptional regulator
MPTGRGPRATLLKQGPLTQRESQILVALCTGLPVKSIAQTVGCSPKTAAIHLERIALKLGVRGMLQTALTAISDGLVSVSRQGVQLIVVGVLAWQVVGLDHGLRHRAPSARTHTPLRMHTSRDAA